MILISIMIIVMMMMMMQANEWGKRYQFWSCADVDIMPPNNFAQVFLDDDIDIDDNDGVYTLYRFCWLLV